MKKLKPETWWALCWFDDDSGVGIHGPQDAACMFRTREEARQEQKHCDPGATIRKVTVTEAK